MVDVRAASAAAVQPLRQAVLRPDQPAEAVEYPGDDHPRALHAAIGDPSGRVVAVGSVTPEDHPRDPRPGDWRLRGMAAAPEFRGRGLGSLVLAACLEHAARHGARRVWCNARIGARSLYDRAGFAVDGGPEPFEIAGIGLHHLMSIALPADLRRVETPGALLGRAHELDSADGRRLLGIAGPPGAGKSTLAAAVVEAVPGAALVSMDGFHLADALLTRLGRRERKGALDTFDGAGFAALVGRLREAGPEPVYAPEFRRELEDSIAAALPVGPEVGLVVLEGNYLLVDEGPWAAVRGMLDEAWYVALDEDERLRRLVARHRRYGATPAEAERRAYGSDAANADVVAATRPRAHRLVVDAVRPLTSRM